MKIDEELIRGCQRYLDTLKEKTLAIEKMKEEQKRIEKQKKIRREYWRQALYERGSFRTFIVPNDSRFKKKQ